MITDEKVLPLRQVFLRVIRILNQLLEWCSKPTVIRCGIGPEFIGHVFVDWAKQHNIRIEYIQPGNLQQNAYIERVNRTIRYSAGSANIFLKQSKQFKTMQRTGYGSKIMNGRIKQAAESNL